MANALVLFGSLTGNTLEVADWIADTLTAEGLTIKSVDCAEVRNVDDLCAPYDLIVFGSPTYGDDPCEVQEDVEPVLENLEATGIGGKNVAVFGLGDSSYPHFCGAVDLIAERVAECGGMLIGDPLRVDDPHGDHADAIRAWARAVATAA